MTINPLEIDRAFDNGEFCPHFQPSIHLRTGELHGFELLARWNHPQRGWIPPDEFIPLAEKDGWINRLTRELLHRGFSAVANLPSFVTLAVNISPVQLREVNLPINIQRIAKEASFSLERLTIEITESSLTDSLDHARTISSALKAMGCKLSLDDFGTGYSSLSQLQLLPFDELKVDRSFVSSMTERRDSRKIVAAVMGLGQSLGLVTLAEGVETQEQAKILQWLGCDLVQGWFYGKPLPAEELADAVSNFQRSEVPREPKNVSERASHTSLDALPSLRLAQLQALYDGVPVGLAFLDRDLRYMTLNQRLADINGLPMGDHLGRTVSEIISELFPKVEGHLRRALNGEAVPAVEVIKPATDTTESKSILVTYEPARDEAGEVVGVSVAAVDLSPIRRAEEARRESEENFRHMMELMPQIPWIIDPEGRALDVSQRWLEITGMTGDQWRGFGWLDALHPDDVEPTWNAMQKAFDSGDSIDVVYRVRRSEADPWKRLRSRGSARIGEDGQIACWYGCLEDAD